MEVFRAAWITEALKRIGGNIDAVAAGAPNRDVTVRIDETIADFTAGGSLHFAHIGLGDESASPAVRVALIDYSMAKKMAPAPSSIKPPAGLWSITFDM